MFVKIIHVILAFMEYDRCEPEAISVKERIKGFDEFHVPLSLKERQQQAARCMPNFELRLLWSESKSDQLCIQEATFFSNHNELATAAVRVNCREIPEKNPRMGFLPLELPAYAHVRTTHRLQKHQETYGYNNCSC